MTTQTIYPKNSFLIRLDSDVDVEPIYRSEFSVAIRTDKRILYVADSVDDYIVERTAENLRLFGEEVVRLDTTCNRKDIFTLTRYIGYPFSDQLADTTSIVKAEPIKLTFFIIGLSRSQDLITKLSAFDSYEKFVNSLVNNIAKNIDIDYQNEYLEWYNSKYDFESVYEFMTYFNMKGSINDGIVDMQIALQSTIKNESMLPTKECCLIVRWDELN